MSLVFVIIFINDNSYFYNHSKLIILLYGALYSKTVGHIQLSHLTNSYFKQIKISTLLIIIVMPLNVILCNLGVISFLLGDKIIFSCLILGILSYLHFFIFVTREISTILGIKIFRIKK